jgi:hypothetical protein
LFYTIGHGESLMTITPAAPHAAPPLTPGLIIGAIQTAPAWALLGLTVPSERLREDALREVAEHVCATLASERDQLPLPLG